MRLLGKTLGLFFILAAALILASCEGKGKIVIKNPPNAKVYINGKYVGKTPIELELREGKYNITVETAPFVEETKKNVQVYFDRTIVLDFHPTPKGILKAESVPSGAEVLDGREPLGKTPLEVKLDPGVHEIFFQKGKLSAVRKVNIEFKKTTKVFANLEKAEVHFNVIPPDATLVVDGKEYHKFPITLELDEGVHTVKVSKGVYSETFKLKVRKGYEFNVTYELKQVQLPPVEAYGPIQLTHNGKYLVSMGKGGIYLWNIIKFRPEISLWDPDDVRNFDRFLNFGISYDDKLISGIKPIRKLAYQFKTKAKRDKILVWDLGTLAPTMSHIYEIESKFVFFTPDKKKVILIEKSGAIDSVDIATASLKKEKSLGTLITAAKDTKDFIYAGDKDGNLYKISKTDLSIEKKKVFNSKVNDIYLSQDKTVIAAVSSDKSLKLVKTDSLEPTFSKTFDREPTSVALSPDMNEVAVAFGKEIDVYNKDVSKQLYKIGNIPAVIISIIFKDGDIIIAASGRETPFMGIWKKGHLLKKWVQTIE